MLIKEGMLPDNVAKDIEDIIDEFDFERVKKVMDFLEWEWCDAEIAIPHIGELRKKARLLLSEVSVKVLKNKEIEAESNIRTGGFQATAYKWENEVRMRLAFILTDWDNYE